MMSNNLQALMNGMSLQWQKERAESQMTLGKLIKLLEGRQYDGQQVIGLGRLDSYRGHYCDLAFEPSMELRSVRDLLNVCYSAMGRVFEGYKGGDYLMGENTPLWVASYGGIGPKLIGLKEGTILMPIVEEEE